MTWNNHVKRLQMIVAASCDDNDLDTVGILRIVQSPQMRNVVSAATTEDERKLSFEIIQMLCRAAEQQRCVWKRDALTTALKHCDHAIDAWEYNENKRKESEAS